MTSDDLMPSVPAPVATAPRARRRPRLALLLPAIAALGCTPSNTRPADGDPGDPRLGSDAGDGADAADGDAGSGETDAELDGDGADGQGGDVDAPLWLETTTLEAGSVVVERVAYRSGSLRVYGEVCRPLAPGPAPVIVWLHGGFAGLGDGERAFCRGAAAGGYVVATPSYRGEDGSDGDVEVCLGEVDDAQAMIAVLRTAPYVAADRLAVIGASHGGCIALALAVREPSLKAAVDLYGPSDWSSLATWWQAQIDGGEPFCAAVGASTTACESVHRDLRDRLVTATGGTPTTAAAAYVARSPAARVGQLDVPLLIIHGEDDWFVTLDQSCEVRLALEAAGRAAQAWFLDPSLQPLPASDPRAGYCGGFTQGALPSTLDGDTYWLVYQRQGHGFTGTGADHASALFLRFVTDRL